MKNCAPCPLYERCLADLNYRQAWIDASHGTIRGAYRLEQEANIVGEDAVQQRIDELGGDRIAAYVYDDNARDPESIAAALSVFEGVNPEGARKYKGHVQENARSMQQLTTMLDTVQASCKGPRQLSIRHWLRRMMVTDCSADRAVFAAQNHPLIEQYGYNLLEQETRNRAFKFENMALGADTGALLASIPTMIFTTAAVSSAALDFAADGKLDAPSWLYHAELYPTGAGLALMIVFGGVGRVLHRIARSYDGKSGLRTIFDE